MEGTVSEEIAHHLDTLCVSIGDYHELASLLRTNPCSPDVEINFLVLYAIEYLRGFIQKSEIERQPFQPMMTGFGRPSYPPPLEKMDVRSNDLYSDLANKCSDGLLTARFAHLVWAKSRENNYKYAVLASNAYLDLLDRATRDLLDRVQDLIYGYDLALSLSNPNLMSLWRAKIEAWVPAMLEDVDASAGAILGALGFLASVKPEFQPPFLDELYNKAYLIFTEPFLRQEILSMKAILNPPSQRSEFGRQSVQLWRDAAATSEGIVQASHLNMALKSAQTSGLHELEEDILLEIANLDLRPYMTEISTSVNIPKEEFDSWIQQFTHFDDWRQSLLAIGRYCPIIHTREQAATEAQNLMNEFPIGALASGMMVDHAGVPTLDLSDSSKLENRINQTETFHITTFGHWLVIILGDFFNKWPITDEDFIEFFHDGVIPKSAALGFTKGFAHYRNQDFESALLVTLPRIEESLRQFSRLNGLRTLISRGGSADKRNLGELISDYRKYSEENLFRYLELLLVHRQGLNLRNDALHGLRGLASSEDAALVLHAALSLRACLVKPEA
jgi:hypothetical protein